MVGLAHVELDVLEVDNPTHVLAAALGPTAGHVALVSLEISASN